MNKNEWSEEFAFMAEPETKEEALLLSRFITEGESETTRGAVLTIVSFIDELLIKILRLYFPNNQHATKLLDELDGCLSSIMNRANIAYALALLREREYKSIRILARIRNEFAHKWDRTNFENPKISKLVNGFPQECFDFGGMCFTFTNKAKFNCVSSGIIQELLKRNVYCQKLNQMLPKEYCDIFDLSREERLKYL